MAASLNLDFYLSSLDRDIQMDVSGMLEGLAPSSYPDVSATAVYYVSTSAMQDAYSFTTDSLDINDISATDITYSATWPAHYKVNPSHAYVIADAINDTADDNRQLVKHDFIRHIAKCLFNTHQAVDLFNNEDEMRNNLAEKGDAEVSDIASKLAENASCEAIFKGMLTKANRFTSLVESVENTEGTYKFPFVTGDSIGFKVNYKPEGDQSNIFENAPTVTERPYLIKLILVDTVTVGVNHDVGRNVTPDDVDDDGTTPGSNNDSYVADA